MSKLSNRIADVTDILKQYPSMLVAYSGGVDSTLLSALAHRVHGDRMLAVFATSPFVSPTAQEQALSVAKEIDFRLLTVDHPLFAVHSPLWNNPPDRCYLCKHALLEHLQGIADVHGLAVITHGENLDDLGQNRPGARAAQELGIKAPFVEAEVTKAEIRDMARFLNLPNADAPSDSCMATRLPHDFTITPKLLDSLAEAERIVSSLYPEATRIRAKITCK